LQQSLVQGLTTALPRSAEFVRVSSALTAVVGLVLLALALLRFGYVANLLSWPTMTGFTTGAALVILASQLPDFFGLRVPREDNFFMRLYRAGQHADTANWRTIVIAFVCVLFLRYAKQVRIRGRGLPARTPLPLLVVFLFVLLSWALDFKGLGVKTVGKIPSTLPEPSAPPLADGTELLAMLPAAFILGVINYVQTISVELVFGKAVGERVNPNTELLALGAMSLGGSCFQCHAVCGVHAHGAAAPGRRAHPRRHHPHGPLCAGGYAGSDAHFPVLAGAGAGGDHRIRGAAACQRGGRSRHVGRLEGRLCTDDPDGGGRAGTGHR
jgi:MFS superfamily sulfate permease-like transporter